MSNNIVKKQTTRGVDILEEAAKLLSQISFSANHPAQARGERVAISVDPRWSDDKQTIRVLITCFALANRQVDWEGLRVEIKERNGTVTWLTWMNPRGQAIRDLLPARGEYRIALPFRVKSQVVPQVFGERIRSRRSLIVTRGQGGEQRGPASAGEIGDQAIQLPEGPISSSIKVVESARLLVSFQTEDPALAMHRIAFSLVQSSNGRVQYSEVVEPLAPGKWRSEFSPSSSADSNESYDLVFETLAPADDE
ncbi:MAG TPA: hypothetical protein VFV34_14420 [Blastocatellia bacterium]|nr:hypothetical protein [Blastocatellia bacterium]